MYVDDDTSTLIACSIEGTYTISYTIVSKHQPRQSLSMDPEGYHMSAELGQPVGLEDMPMWVKGLKIIESLSMITSWSQLQVSIHDLKTHKKLYVIYDLTSHENFVTDILVTVVQQYIITST
jgi:hypothetical protein